MPRLLGRIAFGLVPSFLVAGGLTLALIARGAVDLVAPLWILSGRFGLISADTSIPWYDEALSMDRVEEVARGIEATVAGLGLTEARLILRPADCCATGSATTATRHTRDTSVSACCSPT